MKARCIYCKWSWGISVKQEIPKSGYECPWCASKRKRAQRNASSYRAQRKIILSAF